MKKTKNRYTNIDFVHFIQYLRIVIYEIGENLFYPVYQMKIQKVSGS